MTSLQDLNTNGWMERDAEKEITTCRRCGAVIGDADQWPELHVAWHMETDSF